MFSCFLGDWPTAKWDDDPASVIADCRVRLTELNDSREALRKEVAGAMKERERAQSECVSVKEQVVAARSKLATLTTSQTELSVKLTAIEREVTELEADVPVREARLSQLRRKRERIEADISSEKTGLTDARSDVAVIRSQIAEEEESKACASESLRRVVREKLDYYAFLGLASLVDLAACPSLINGMLSKSLFPVIFVFYND